MVDALAEIVGQGGYDEIKNDRKEIILKAKQKVATFQLKVNQVLYNEQLDEIVSNSPVITQLTDNNVKDIYTKFRDARSKAQEAVRIQEISRLAASGYQILMELSDFIRGEEIKYAIYMEGEGELKVGVVNLNQFTENLTFDNKGSLNAHLPSDMTMSKSVLSDIYYKNFRENAEARKQKQIEDFKEGIQNIYDINKLRNFIEENYSKGRSKNKILNELKEKNSIDEDYKADIIKRYVNSVGNQYNRGRDVERSAALYNNDNIDDFNMGEHTEFWLGPDFRLKIDGVETAYQAKNITTEAGTKLASILSGMQGLINILADVDPKVKQVIENDANGTEEQVYDRIFKDLQQYFGVQ